MRVFPFDLIFALIATILIEGVVVLLLKRSLKWLYYSLLCNMLTNPLLNLSLYAFIILFRPASAAYYICVGIGECIVVTVEYALYRALTKEKPGSCLLVSFTANLISFLSGFLLL